MNPAKAYHRAKLLWWLGLTGLQLALPLVWIRSGAAAGTASGFPDTPWLSWLAATAAWYGLWAAARLLPAWFGGYRLEVRHGMTRQSPAGWALDELKKTVIGFVLFAAVAAALGYLSRYGPEPWWPFAAAASFALSVVVTAVFPLVLLPLFHRAVPLEAGPLRERLEALCRRAGLARPDLRCLELGRKTVRANAAVTGLGGSRRILLSDTLIESHGADEIEMVLAHELGHDRERHLGWGLALTGCAAAAGSWLLAWIEAPAGSWAGMPGGYADPAAAALVWWLLQAGQLFTTPVSSAFSRALERRADRYALRLVPLPEVFRSMLTRLSRRNLADPDPHPLVEWALYSHPSLRNRLRSAGL